MLAAGYLRGGPAHSDNSPCSLSLEDNLRLQNLIKLKEFLESYFCCAVRNVSCLRLEAGVIVVAWYIWWRAWNALHVYGFPLVLVSNDKCPLCLYICNVWRVRTVIEQGRFGSVLWSSSVPWEIVDIYQLRYSYCWLRVN
jgi:hypothetical protein